MPVELPGVDIKEHITLRKIDGDVETDPAGALVVETVEIEDGVITETIVHDPPLPFLSLP